MLTLAMLAALAVLLFLVVASSLHGYSGKRLL